MELRAAFDFGIYMLLFFLTGACRSSNNIRLADGCFKTEGRVEIFHDGEWGTVCDNNWDSNDAMVVCRQLGLKDIGSKAVPNAFYRSGSGKILLDKVNCSGSELGLDLCPSSGWNNNNCSHSQDASVKCAYVREKDDIRLDEGDQRYAGRVEVLLNDTWGTVCDNHWNENDARVVCRQLDLPTDIVWALKDGFYGSGVGDILLDDVHCNGSEVKLSLCPSKKSGITCNHSQDAAVRCDYGQQSIRLVNGTNQNKGRLELFYEQKWWRVCSETWNDMAARVACKQLGYKNDIFCPRNDGQYGRGTGPILDNVQCNGTEDNIQACLPLLIQNGSCTHKTDAGIICGAPCPPSPPSGSLTTAELTGIIAAGVFMGIIVILVTLALAKLPAYLRDQKWLQGDISFLELWRLTTSKADEDDKSYLFQLQSMCTNLLKGTRSISPEIKEIFGGFISWKDDESTRSTRRDIYDRLKRERVVMDVKSFKEIVNRYSTIPDFDIAHIALSIQHTITYMDPTPEFLEIKDRNIPIQCTDLKQELTSWKEESMPKGLSQEIIMSQALEKARFGNIASTYVQIPDKYKKDIDPDEITSYASHISRRHCMKLGLARKLSRQQYIAINKENLYTLFKTKDMLTNGIAKATENFRNYDIRCVLRKVAEDSGQSSDIADLFICKESFAVDQLHSFASDRSGTGETSEFGGGEDIQLDEPASMEPTENEPLLSPHTPLHKKEGKKIVRRMKSILKGKKSRDTGETEIKEFQNQEFTKEAHTDPMDEFEIFETAYSLFMDDVFPFAEALGYNFEELNIFRKPFEKRSEVGTFGLLSDVVKNLKFSRKATCTYLISIGYGEIAAHLKYGKFKSKNK